MGIKDQMRKKRKKQELLDDLPDYERDRSAAGTGSSGTEKSGRIEENLWAIFLI